MEKDLIKVLNLLTDEEFSLLELNKKEPLSNPNAIVKGNDLYSNEDIIIRKLTRFTYFLEHEHKDYVELSYGITGCVEHTINAKKVIVSPNDFLATNINIKHATNTSTIDDMAINFLINKDYLKNLILKLKDIEVQNICLNIFFYNEDYKLIKNIQDETNDLVYTLIKFLVYKHYNIVDIKPFIEYTILNLMVKLAQKKSTSIELGELKLIDQLDLYIKENYASASLYEFANITNINYHELSKIIKREYGAKFIDLLIQRRLLVSLELLRNTEFTTAKISQHIGYTNISFFYKLFKKHYGITPNEYRNKFIK